MARFSVYKMYMPMHDDRKWWSCGEASGNSSDISVTDGGGRSVTVNLAASGLYDSSAIGVYPAAGTGVSCCTVTAAVSAIYYWAI